MPTVYLLDAVDCPAPQVPTALLIPGTNPAVKASLVTAGASGPGSTSTPFNANAAHLDNLGGAGGAWAYAVITGLELTAGTGLTLNISAGGAGVGAVPTVAAAQTKALTNGSENHVWMLRDGSISLRQNVLTPPATPGVYLGRVTTLAGAITAIDYSGRVENRGGALWRKTGDAAAPGDTPPAGIILLTETDGGLYLWTGTAYASLPDLATAHTWASKQTFDAEVELNGALNHDGSTVGFRGATPQAMPSALVQTYSTADRTLSAYTPDAESGAYTGIDNAQGATPYATVADLNALRVAYENLRAFAEDLAQLVNALVDDFQANGLEQ